MTKVPVYSHGIYHLFRDNKVLSQCGLVHNKGKVSCEIKCSASDWEVKAIYRCNIYCCTHEHLAQHSTPLVLKPEYSRTAKSIPWRLLSWLLVLPGHWHSWYWLCTIYEPLLSMSESFKSHLRPAHSAVQCYTFNMFIKLQTYHCWYNIAQ